MTLYVNTVIRVLKSSIFSLVGVLCFVCFWGKNLSLQPRVAWILLWIALLPHMVTLPLVLPVCWDHRQEPPHPAKLQGQACYTWVCDSFWAICKPCKLYVLIGPWAQKRRERIVFAWSFPRTRVSSRAHTYCSVCGCVHRLHRDLGALSLWPLLPFIDTVSGLGFRATANLININLWLSSSIVMFRKNVETWKLLDPLVLPSGRTTVEWSRSPVSYVSKILKSPKSLQMIWTDSEAVGNVCI